MKDVADDLAFIVRNSIAYIKELEAELARCKQVCAATAEAWREEAALAEPVQEPVALDWLHKWANQDDGEPETQWHEGYEAARRVVQIHLTAPPQRKPLTGQEYADVYEQCADWDDFARAIERAHGIT